MGAKQMPEETDRAREQLEKRARTLARNSRLWEILTFAMVVVVSPASFLFGLPFGIDPMTWLGFWLKWTVLFIVLAIMIALLGFDAASNCWLEAEHLRKQLNKK